MSDYRAGTSGNLALAALTLLVPQPRCAGLQYTRRTMVASGGIVEEGPYTIWHWNVVDDVAQYVALLNYVGLGTGLNSRLVTIYTVNAYYGYARYNATVIRPAAADSIIRRDYMLRDMELLFKDLVAL